MKQVFYTSCEAGKSLGGDEGFQVRAASAGIGPERIRAAVPYMAYGLPTHVHPLQVTPASSPVRLAFLKTPELGSVLCHSVSAGVDPSTHRPGNFFSHLLMDLPPAFTATAAIKTWGSDSWQRADGPIDVMLPETEGIPAAEAITDEALRQFLSTEHGQRMFCFVLSAMLTTEADWRVFLAALSQDVAMCIYGLTRVLPEGCQGKLTFSTYESQPLNCPARVVGTWGADSAETDMPSSCYFGRAVGYNACTGRASEVAPGVEFVDYAITAAMTGDYNGLDSLRAVCDYCEIDRPGVLNLACHAELGGVLSKDDVRRLTANPRFLAHLLSKPTVQRPLLDHFTEAQDLTGVLAEAVVPVLKEASETIGAFRETAKRTTIEAVLHGNLGQTRALLEHILPAASGVPAASTHLAVMAEIKDPRAVPWQTRAYLLTQMAAIPSNGQQAALRAQWLAPSPDELPVLCGLAIPNVWKAHACLMGLRESGVTHTLVETLTNHFDVLVEVLRHLPADKQAAGSLPSLVASLLAHSHAPAKLAGEMVRRRGELSPEVTSAFLAAAARNGAIDVFSLASHSGPGLLAVLKGGEGLHTFLFKLLDCPLERLLNDSQVLALFQAAVGNMDRGELRNGLESVLAIRSFLDRTVLSGEALASVATALRTLQTSASSAVGEAVLEVALDTICIKDDSSGIGRIVESLLLNFGSLTPGGPNALYRWLVEQFRDRKDFWQRQHLICALVAVGLGATSTDPSRQAVAMAEQARDLAEEVAKRSKRLVFTFIERQSRSWPDEARMRWNLFAKFIRPQQLIDRFAGPWKKMAAVPLAVICLIVGVSRMGCRTAAIGTFFANEETTVRQSHETTNPPVERIAHDRPQP